MAEHRIRKSWKCGYVLDAETQTLHRRTGRACFSDPLPWDSLTWPVELGSRKTMCLMSFCELLAISSACFFGSPSLGLPKGNSLTGISSGNNIEKYYIYNKHTVLLLEYDLPLSLSLYIYIYIYIYILLKTKLFIGGLGVLWPCPWACAHSW